MKPNTAPTLPPCHKESPRHAEWLERVASYEEDEGMTTSEAQDAADLAMDETRRPTIELELGRVVATAGVMRAVGNDPHKLQGMIEALHRHAGGDWGEVDWQDADTNTAAAMNGDGRILSAYTVEGVGRIWIITEWDRSVTTFLFPSEY